MNEVIEKLTASIDRLTTAELLDGFPPKARDMPRVSAMTDEQLARWAEYCRRNTRNDNPITYDAVLKEQIVPELLRRLLR